MVNTNVLYCGDCLTILKGFPNDSVDLIYIDPPFYSGKPYEFIWGNGAEKRAFEDRWKGGINHYIGWMQERLEQCYRILKKEGSIYLHCDWHANHYLKILMDKIFDKNNFRNEIIWKRTHHPKGSQFKDKRYGVYTDYILFYTKSNKYTFELERIRRPLTEEELKEKYPKVDKKGKYLVYPIIRSASKGERPNLVYEYKGYTPHKWGWVVNKTKLIAIDKRGDLGWTSKRTPFRKYRQEEDRGEPVGNLWDDIHRVGGDEALGYPTQKPEKLLERIINVSSNSNDIVLDPMVGGGTTLAIAQKLGRKWIGVDVSPVACKLTQKRLRSIGVKDVVILGLPNSMNDLKKLPHFEFQNWVCKQLNGKISDKKSGDMGIDGWILGTIPIQVKQSEGVGRIEIDKFAYATSSRAGKKKGVFVAFSYGKGAYEEVATAKIRNNVEIKLLTIDDMLKAEFNPMELFK